MTMQPIEQGNAVAKPAMQPATNQKSMRLIEWAEEAQAASHLAQALCRTPFAGSWKGDQDGATAAILKGAELGLTPVTALGAFDNIQGRPAPSAITLRAFVQSHGHEIELIEEAADRAVARYRRKGAEEWRTTDFTLDEAQAMGLLGRDQWKKQPRNMLVARVTAKAARLVASDVILGIGYSAEEIRDMEPWDGTTRPPRVTVEQSGSASDRMAAALNPVTTEEVEQWERDDEQTDSPLLDVRSGLAKAMYAAINESGLADDDRLTWISAEIGREITSTKEMSEAEARTILDALKKFEPEVGDPA